MSFHLRGDDSLNGELLLPDRPFVLASNVTLITGNEGNDSFPKLMYSCLRKTRYRRRFAPGIELRKGCRPYREAPYGDRYHGPWRVRP